MNRILQAAVYIALTSIVLAGCASVPTPGKRELMLVANDQKILWDDAGKPIMMAPGKDNVLVVDIGTNPLEPKIIANLPLMNTIFGPPTNLQITPHGKGSGGQFDGLVRRRRIPEGRTRQQAVCDRPHPRPA